ncbi:hypothetical protein [Mycobacterium sp. DBP42]|uniref:hypothetical protein n=1 Tax=Mycobacteriaceae TaxID=1762 RepID=UPI00110CA1F8|nr:hypothetical protein [Mycobacterium sp. DBP42]TMS50702.1 hypothetical protein E0T84_22720 [Mycobacterium sp. DBP42]
MITEIASTVVASGDVAGHVSYVAAPIWDVGAQIKSQGITFAVYLLIGGTALIVALAYFVSKDKTFALKTAAVGIVLIGIVAALPALGVMSKDTMNGLVGTSGVR